jgi:Na+/H+ antiporter NhaD/arsenite permease-like protein
MGSLLKFCKNELVLIISAVAALISCFFVPVTDYIKYVDLDMLCVLFCLMLIVAGFSENNVFKRLSQVLIRKAGNTKSLAMILVFLTFFSSMLITNDVSLITFVPFTIITFASAKQYIILVVTLQTVAANLGSMLMPMGSPHNLLLFSVYKMSIADFISITGPVCAAAFVLILAVTLFIKKEKIEISTDDDIEVYNKSYLILYFVLFILCILSIFKVINVIIVFASVLAVILIAEPALIKKADYGLLLTFVFFFIFIGNVQNINSANEFITKIISGREFESSIALSQIISNVPAAAMLSGFTEKAKSLILGTNIGGLGTIIASLASLISFKLYTKSEDSRPIKYILIFSVVNFSFLIILYVYASLMFF